MPNEANVNVAPNSADSAANTIAPNITSMFGENSPPIVPGPQYAANQTGNDATPANCDAKDDANAFKHLKDGICAWGNGTLVTRNEMVAAGWRWDARTGDWVRRVDAVASMCGTDESDPGFVTCVNSIVNSDQGNLFCYENPGSIGCGKFGVAPLLTPTTTT